MAKFGKIAAKKVKSGAKADFEFFGIENMEGAMVTGRPAVRRLNLPYANAVLAKSERLNRQARASKDKASILIAQTDATREPFARYVLTGWKNIKDENGKPVPFSTDDAIEFVNALPDFMYEELLVFFSTESNFVDEVSEEDAKATAKN